MNSIHTKLDKFVYEMVLEKLLGLHWKTKPKKKTNQD